MYKILKWTIICILLVCSILNIWGIYSSILVAESLFVPYWVESIASILAILSVYYIYKKYYYQSKINFKISKTTFVLSLFFGIFVSIILFAERSFPLLAHTLVKEPSTINVTVKNKHIGSYKFCHRSFELEGYSLFFNGKICNVDNKTYDSIKRGDELKLVGDSSVFGFTVESYEQRKKENKYIDYNQYAAPIFKLKL